jgi:hypothetical protein
MRPDMHKVIVERERLGGPVKYRRPGRERNRDPDDLPRKEGMRRPHLLCRSRKSLNENLAPLRKYLRKQVGRPWNAVYSEISARLAPTSPVKQHVRDHLWDFVERHPIEGAGGHMYAAWHGAGWVHRLLEGDLFVDPRSGILRTVKPYRFYKARR